MEITHLSASQLNTLRECPRRWWYYVNGCPEDEVDNRYADRGSAVHKAIEEHIEGRRPDHLSLTEHLDEQMYSEYRRCFETYLDLGRAVCLQNPAAELELEAVVHGIRLIGRLDVVDGETVIDWKTGNPSESERYQAAVYQHLMRANGAQDPEVLFVHLKSGEIRRAPRYPEDYVPAIVSTHLETIRSGKFPATGNGCRWCRYRSLCEVGR